MIIDYSKRVWYEARIDRWHWRVAYNSDTDRSCLEHGVALTRDQAESDAYQAMIAWEAIDSK